MTVERNLASDRIVRDLLALYAEAQHELVLQVTQAIASGDLATARRRRTQLQSALDVLEQIGVKADPLARQAVRQAAVDGGDSAAAGIRKIGVRLDPIGEQTFASVNADAVATMQESLVSSLQGARTTVGRQIQDVYAREGRKQVMRSLLGAEGSPDAARRRLARELAANGKTSFVDRAGRRWALQDYADMATRAVTREAVVQGSVNRMVSHGVNLARVSKHAGSCEVCRPYEGRLVDLGGNTRDFQGEPVMDASTIPPFHPRCAHTLMPFASRIEEIRRQLAAGGVA